MIRKRWMILGTISVVLLLLFLYLFVFAGNQTACENPGGYSLNPDVKGSLGVLIVYMDPGIDHTRAQMVFDAARNAGAKWVRIGLIWAIANPAPGEYNLTEFDWIIDAALSRNLSVLPVVMFTPRWASGAPGSDEYYLYPPENMETIYEFARTVASHYGGRVDHWELWNEPDMDGFFRDLDGDGSRADDYAKMLAYFYRGVKEGNPDADVVLGGLADFPGAPGCEEGFLEKILSDEEYPAGNNFDILNIHTNFRSPEEIKDQIARDRALIEKFGFEKPLWITETSYTPVKRFQILPYYQGEEGFQRYVHDSLVVELNSGVQVAFWAALHDYGDDRPEDDPYKYSGLYTYDLKPKPALYVFRDLAEDLEHHCVDTMSHKSDMWREK